MPSLQVLRAAGELFTAVVRNGDAIPLAISFHDALGQELLIKIEFAPRTIVGISLGPTRPDASFCRKCGGTQVCQACAGTGDCPGCDGTGEGP